MILAMKPTPGSQYTVETGDTLPSIASSAYGDPAKQSLIRDVNQSQIKFSNVEDVAPGQVILIPLDTVLDAIRQKQLQNGLK